MDWFAGEEGEVRDILAHLADDAMSSARPRFAMVMALLDMTFREPFIDEDAEDHRKILLGIQLHAHHNLLAGWHLLRAGLADAAAMHLRTAIEAPIYLKAARSDQQFALDWDRGRSNITSAWKVIRLVDGKTKTKTLSKALNPILKVAQQYSHVSAGVAEIGSPLIEDRGRFIAPSGLVHNATTAELAHNFSIAAVTLIQEVQVICFQIDKSWDAESAELVRQVGESS